MLDDYLIIGEILKPQGIRGEVKLRPLTDDPGRFEGLKRVFFKSSQGFEQVDIRVTRIHEDSVYLFIQGVGDREAAEALRGTLLYIDRGHAVKQDEDAEFICDLIGCKAVDTCGNTVGILREVLQPGGNDVYRFETPKGFLMLPALNRVILEVDVSRKHMLLDAERVMEMGVWEV
jgi:16S rRNA processing protein RimM